MVNEKFGFVWPTQDVSQNNGANGPPKTSPSTKGLLVYFCLGEGWDGLGGCGFGELGGALAGAGFVGLGWLERVLLQFCLASADVGSDESGELEKGRRSATSAWGFEPLASAVGK